ncbi:MAG: aminotransferase class III-fold pyridoxal phosphate-dependent enzyme [Actinomycetia bacterium]|nr:aminotransferase class III-fold pyridoxal phosphate-dependent enzyme [Actinomycetes bacterium]
MHAAVFNSTGHQMVFPEIVSGDGIYVTDSGGGRYMDLTSGVWCMSLGHRNRRVNDAIAAQIDALTHAGFCYSHPIVEQAAVALLSVCGFEDGSAVFLCSGSEGIDYARQAVRAITNRTVSGGFHDAYLGSLSSAIDRSNNWFSLDWESCRLCPGGRRMADCGHLDEIPEDLSEFVFELGSSSGQVRFAPIPLVRKVAAAVRDRGAKIVANEVTTGIGRTGAWFGFDHYGIEPDLIVIGKGIGNGYPVSAVVMNRDTAAELEATSFRYMQSHQNDPLGAAVVNEVIAVIRDEDLISRAASAGPVFLGALQGLLAHPAVLAVRGRGLMFAIDLCDEDTGDEVHQALIERGYIVCLRGATLRIDPPLITTHEEFLSFAEALEDSLATI